MIYEKEQLKSLPPVKNKLSDVKKKLSFREKLLGILNIFKLLILLPYLAVKILFIMMWTLGKFFTNIEGNMEMKNRELKKEEQEQGFLYEMVSASNEYDHENDTIYNRMNYHALKAFIHNIRKTYKGNKEIKRQGRLNKFLFGKAYRAEDPGFHIHSEFFMPDLEYEITIGTSDSGLLTLNGGDNLWGSPKIWKEICEEWDRVAEERKPKLIVLDSYQSDWCDSKSIGRFIIEYEP